MKSGARKLELSSGKIPRLRQAGPKAFVKTHQDIFLAALAATCNVREACRQAGFTTTTVYDHRKRNARFRAAWAEAVKEAYGRLELMMLEKMMDGTLTTKTRADGSIETVHEYPLALALQLLRLHRANAAEAAIEHDPDDIDEVRDRIALRISRLRERMQAEAGRR